MSVEQIVNLLPFNAGGDSDYNSGNIVERDGITFTVNSDGSVTINGTCTEDTWFSICPGTPNQRFQLSDGEYVINLNNLPDGVYADFNAYRVAGQDYSTTLFCTDHLSDYHDYYHYYAFDENYPIQFPFSRSIRKPNGQYESFSGEVSITIYIKSGTSLQNYILRPMLEYGRVPHDFETPNNNPKILYHPKNESIFYSGNVTFTVGACGAGLLFEWQCRENSEQSWSAVSGESYTGEESDVLTVAASSILDGYQFRCAVRNDYGTIYSDAATLTVNTSNGVALTSDNFPGETLRNFLSTKDTDNDGILNDSELVNITSFAIGSQTGSIEGIQLLPALSEVILASDLSGGSCAQTVEFPQNTNIKFLGVEGGSRQKIDVSKCAGLRRISSSNVTIDSLDLSSCQSLETVYISGGSIGSLIFGNNPFLSDITCWDISRISSIDVSNLPLLSKFRCEDNRNLTNINASGCTSLDNLIIEWSGNAKNTNVESIDLSGCTSLKDFGYTSSNGKLKTLNLSGCTGLTSVDVTSGNLETLNISGCNNLIQLQFKNNKVSEIDLSLCTNLKYLSCYNNPLPEIDLSSCDSILGIFRQYTSPSHLYATGTYEDYISFYIDDEDGYRYINVDYQTILLGVKAIIETNPVGAVVTEGESVSFDTAASGLDIAYQWQRRRINQSEQAVLYNSNSICNIYSDGTITINQHEASNFNYTTYVLLADAQFPVGTYSIFPNAVSDSDAISIAVFSDRTPPISFGHIVNDQVEDDPCIDIDSYLGSSSNISFTVTNPNHYVCVTLDVNANAQIEENTLKPVIKRRVGDVYEDISYIWTYYPIWTDIDDAVSNTLSLTASAENDDTQYRCKVYNRFSEAYTDPAELGVILPPTIIQQPQRQVIKNNTSVTFSIEATAKEDSNSYQWQVSTDGGETWMDAADGGTNGGSISEYTITATKSMDHYLYRCIATNIAGTETSDPAELRVLIEPSISAQPENLTVETSKTATFHIIAAGDELRYKWQVSADNGVTWNDTDPIGDSFDYSFNAEKSLNGNKYQCVVTNDVGSATSNAASLKVLDAPVILDNPIAVTVRDSNNASFSVSASGDELNYQWQVSTDGGANWEDIAGETADTYSFTALFAMNGDRYRCKVYNDVKTVYTEAALLTVTIQPSITQQPQNTTVASGSNAVFTVGATDREGAGLAYTWQVKESENGEWIAVSGDAYSGYSTASLTVTASTDIDGNQYRCLIEGGHDNILSESAAIDVVAMPVITGELQNTAIRSGSSVSLTASAAGKYISYQWQTYLNDQWVDIANAVSDTYTIVQENPENNDVGIVKYRCAVTNIAGTVTSSTATITVIPSIILYSQPLSVESPAGGIVRFTVGVSGGRLKYCWQTRGRSSSAWGNVNGGLYSGETTQTLSVSVETALSGNQYRCIITDEYSDDYPSLSQILTSDAATLTTSSQQVILTQPADSTVAEGDLAGFEVIVNGNGYTYQWQVSTDNGETWNNIQNNGNSPIYVFTANVNQNGAKYCCVVSTAEWAIFSRAATLTVVTEPVITTQPQSVRTAEENIVEFHVEASNPSLNYQWQVDTGDAVWTDIQDERATTDTIFVTATMQLSGYKYRCKVYNIAGTKYSNDALLTVIEKIRILSNPEDQIAANGDTVSFSVSASGYLPSYQWQEKAPGTDVWINVQDVSAESATLNVIANEESDGKQYRCFITNDAGENTSTPALLTVYFKPVFTVQPQNVRVGEGKIAEFHAEASGAGLSYQWQICTDGSNWEDITGDEAQTNTLSVTVTLQDDGNRYRCKVHNIAGTTYSNDVLLNVIEKVRIITNPEDMISVNGDVVSFSVLVTGYYPSYQWQSKTVGGEVWVNVQETSATSQTLSITANEQSNGKLYRCLITNDAGEEASTPALLTVYFKPTFTVQPQSVDVDEGSVVYLHAEANGGGVSYQWQSKRENGTYWSDLTIDGATSDTLPLIAHIAINGVQYRCVATNLAGTTESDPAMFHVNITSFCLADGSEIDEGVLPAGYYTFNPNADRKGIVYDIGLFDGANTDWVVVEASSARTFYTNGRKAIKILFHHTDNADLEYYAIRPMLEEGQEAHQWASPANAAYEHDAANDFNYGWFSIGNKYGDRENIVTASAPCVMTLRYRPIWKDTL